MKLILLLLSIGLGGFIGIKTGKKYKPPEYFFKELTDFLQYSVNSINLYKTPLPSIVETFSADSNTDLANFLKNYADYLKNSDYSKSELEKIIKNLPLCDDEKNELCIFFHSLGRFSEDEEKSKIKSFAEYCEKRRSYYAEMDAKYGKMIVKLGFTAGAIVGILLI